MAAEKSVTPGLPAAARARRARREPDRPHKVLVMASERTMLTLAGREVAVSNPGKVFFPELGLTKLDLVTYYVAVAEGALRGVGDRIGPAWVRLTHSSYWNESRLRVAFRNAGIVGNLRIEGKSHHDMDPHRSVGRR